MAQWFYPNRSRLPHSVWILPDGKIGYYGDHLPTQNEYDQLEDLNHTEQWRSLAHFPRMWLFAGEDLDFTNIIRVEKIPGLETNFEVFRPPTHQQLDAMKELSGLDPIIWDIHTPKSIKSGAGPWSSFVRSLRLSGLMKNPRHSKGDTVYIPAEVTGTRQKKSGLFGWNKETYYTVKMPRRRSFKEDEVRNPRGIHLKFFSRPEGVKHARIVRGIIDEKVAQRILTPDGYLKALQRKTLDQRDIKTSALLEFTEQGLLNPLDPLTLGIVAGLGGTLGSHMGGKLIEHGARQEDNPFEHGGAGVSGDANIQAQLTKIGTCKNPVSKKDFDAIAKTLLSQYPDATRDRIARELADYFKSQNSRFNREQFLTAAGVAYTARNPRSPWGVDIAQSDANIQAQLTRNPKLSIIDMRMLHSITRVGPAQPQNPQERASAERLIRQGLLQWITIRGASWLSPTHAGNAAMRRNPMQEAFQKYPGRYEIKALQNPKGKDRRRNRNPLEPGQMVRVNLIDEQVNGQFMGYQVKQSGPFGLTTTRLATVKLDNGRTILVKPRSLTTL